VRYGRRSHTFGGDEGEVGREERRGGAGGVGGTELWTDVRYDNDT
jgi:hypothetical protein